MAIQPVRDERSGDRTEATAPDGSGLPSDGRGVASAERRLRDGAALRAENAGLLAGGWFAYPTTRVGAELIGASLLIIAGPIDGDKLIRWLAEGKARAWTSWTANDF